MTNEQCCEYVKTPEYKELYDKFKAMAATRFPAEMKTALFLVKYTPAQMELKATGFAFGLMRAYMLLLGEVDLTADQLKSILLDESR